MKQQGWSAVVRHQQRQHGRAELLQSRQAVSFTIMRMGDKTNVTADGSALKVAVKPDAAMPRVGGACRMRPATAEDLAARKAAVCRFPSVTP